MNFRAAGVILFAGAVAYCVTLSARAAGPDATAGKCLAGTHTVRTIKGDFVPTDWPQRVVVTRKLDTARDGVYCLYHIGWQAYQPNMRRWFAFGDGWTVKGPGLVFAGGIWQPQLAILGGHEHLLRITPVHVLPGHVQLAIYQEEDAMGGIFSDLAIYVISGTPAAATTILHVRDMGGLTYSVQRGVVDLKGEYFGPNACNACGKPGYEVRLKFDPGAKQMAIVTPDAKSELFYKSILVQNAKR